MKESIIFFALVLNAMAADDVYTPPKRDMPVGEMKTLADRYWRRVDGTNYWLATLVDWERNPNGSVRPLPQWQHISGTAYPRPNVILVMQDQGRQPSMLVLTNYPREAVHGDKIDCYAVNRGGIHFKATKSSSTQRLWFFDFGEVIAPPATNAVAGPGK